VTYHIFKANDHAVIGTSTPIIKAAERSEFTSAVALLQAITELRNATESQAQSRGETAYQEGLARGYADAEQKVAKLIQDMAERFEMICEQRRSDVADAALAATKAIIGSLDKADVTKRLVTQALLRVDNGAPLVIEVAPAMASHIVNYVAHLPHVRVEAVDGLGPLDCIFQTSSGRVLAGLDLQIAALGNRWGVNPTNVEPEMAAAT
jgi:flagellar biosynthesis/type III secretory pathway protein FliH